MNAGRNRIAIVSACRTLQLALEEVEYLLHGEASPEHRTKVIEALVGSASRLVELTRPAA